METRHWIMISAVLALLVLAGGVCMCGGFGLLVASAPDDGQEIVDLQATNEGTAAGQRGTTESCIVATHDRTLGCGVVDPNCTLGAQDFLRACLRAVPSPDPTLCNGVPDPSTMGDWGFADTICRQRGWSSDAGECDPIADAISSFCHP